MCSNKRPVAYSLSIVRCRSTPTAGKRPRMPGCPSFPSVLVVECFFHAFLKIRQRATASLQAHVKKTSDRVWQLYRAEGKPVRRCGSFAQRFRRLREWDSVELPASAMSDNVLKMCAKAQVFSTLSAVSNLGFNQRFRSL